MKQITVRKLRKTSLVGKLDMSKEQDVKKLGVSLEKLKALLGMVLNW